MNIVEDVGESNDAERKVDDKANEGEDLDFPEPHPHKVVVSALTPELRKATGHVADGVVTWMVSQRTIRDYTVPEIRRAAEDAERAAPRISVGLPVCVHDEKGQAVVQANEIYNIYNRLPTYRRQLDVQGVENPGEIAVVGNEQEVEVLLETFLNAGATEIIDSIFPVGDNRRESFAGSTECLQRLL